LSLKEIQQFLGSNEGLLVYAFLTDEDFFTKTVVNQLFVVTKSAIKLHQLKINREELEGDIKTIRSALDARRGLQPFPLETAHKLFQKLLEPALPELEGVTHLLIVKDGPLQSIPFALLTTKPPESGVAAIAEAEHGDEELIATRGSWGKKKAKLKKKTVKQAVPLESYRDAPWLINKFAVSTLPAVSSLRALRRNSKASRADLPFIGIGDPVLAGHAGSVENATPSSLFRGALANVTEVRGLASLPDTADELATVAKTLGAGEDSLYLRERATETEVKSAPLKRARVVSFATHGLISGELKGLAEPALVLTPPETATEQDDGLLTVSEVAQLKLDADWVVLSACNTASADGKTGSEGLSGLAKSFFYAGSRALLVSHWPVVSEAAKELTVGTFSHMKKAGEVGRAEALRRSMRDMIARKDNPRFAHPLYWAPFVVVGEGGL
jgi:CHAT domain-containing protein